MGEPGSAHGWLGKLFPTKSSPMGGPWVAHGLAHSKSGPTNNFIQFVCFFVLIVKLQLIYALCLLIN